MVSKSRRIFLLLAVIALAGGAGIFAFTAPPPKPETPLIPGMVRETLILIAPEISGRLATLYVRPGQQVALFNLLPWPHIHCRQTAAYFRGN